MTNPHLWLVFLFSIFCYNSAFGRDLIYYTNNSSDVKTVLIENKSSEVQDLWLIFYAGEFLEEVHIPLPPHFRKNLSLSDLKSPHWDMAILTKSSLVKLPASWTTQMSTTYLKNVSNQRVWEFNSINLNLTSQLISLRYENKLGQIIKTETLESATYMKSKKEILEVPAGTQKIHIESEQPLSLPSEKGLQQILDSRRKPKTGTSYFLVQFEPGSTFLAPLTDPNLIQMARDEIQNPQGLILLADIEKNANSPNQNWSLSHKPYWSWHIKTVTGLVNLAADWCQAYPEMIERMLTQILAQEKVCFRGSQIVRELKPEEFKP